MIGELCCCTVIFVIAVIILLRIFGRAVIINQSRRAQPPYGTQSPDSAYRDDSANEITMRKCSFCGVMHDERLPQCPKCGALEKK